MRRKRNSRGKKKAFSLKNVDYTKALSNAAIRVSGGIGAGVLTQLVASKLFKDNPKAGMLSSGVVALVGVGLSEGAGNEALQRLGEGMQAAAGYNLAMQVIPEGIKTKLGINGLGQVSGYVGMPMDEPLYLVQGAAPTYYNPGAVQDLSVLNGLEEETIIGNTIA